jgi:hypothetical protein
MATEIYEYAGFRYTVVRGDGRDKGDIEMVPVVGQHKAAWKDKHTRNARECYLEDQKLGKGMGHGRRV